MLRQSIRRSVRRLMGEPSRNRLTVQQNHSLHISNDETSLPPDYTSIFSTNPSGDIDSSNIEMGPRILYNSQTHRDTLQVATVNINERNQRNLTATDVAQLLRPGRPKSHRTLSLGGTGGTVNRSARDSVKSSLSVSLEDLNSKLLIYLFILI